LDGENKFILVKVSVGNHLEDRGGDERMLSKHIPIDIPQVMIGGLSNPNELDSYAGDAMLVG
jgi:hypothetical protein